MCLRADGTPSAGMMPTIAHNTPKTAIVTSIMLEMCLRGRLECSTDGQLFSLKGDSKIGDDIMDDAIEKIKDKQLSLGGWLKNINGTVIFTEGVKDLLPRVYGRLVEKKVLREVKGMRGTTYPFEDTQEIERLTQKLREALRTKDISTLDERSLCLIGIFHALDKPYIHTPDNALDINRILPDKNERSKIRENLVTLLENANKSEIANLSTAVSHSIVTRTVRAALLGWMSVLFNL